ncbi:hypothetical protein BY458DRAFT_529743 [Sporodiniella umbellata]|nr:hypothetical protein BY458DRAFT_529743 [Sporodiniella umbellata]
MFFFTLMMVASFTYIYASLDRKCCERVVQMSLLLGVSSPLIIYFQKRSDTSFAFLFCYPGHILSKAIFSYSIYQ